MLWTLNLYFTLSSGVERHLRPRSAHDTHCGSLCYCSLLSSRHRSGASQRPRQQTINCNNAHSSDASVLFCGPNSDSTFELSECRWTLPSADCFPSTSSLGGVPSSQYTAAEAISDFTAYEQELEHSSWTLPEWFESDILETYPARTENEVEPKRLPVSFGES